jgi:ParB family chromosome partitioning protein
MPSSRDQKRLGKGLASLVRSTEHGPGVSVSGSGEGTAGAAEAGAEPGASHRPIGLPATGAAAVSGTIVRHIRCDEIKPNPFQPRSAIGEPDLERLADSILSTGLVQPIVVRQRGDGYEMIAGERRWRACELAGLKEVPAIIRAATDEQTLEIALIENIFREDLNAMDRARAYRRYCEEFGLGAEQIAKRLNEDRTTVVNYLRLLELPISVQEMVEDGRLSMGHARALAGLEKREEIERLAELVITNFFSVRALEATVRKERERRAGGKADAEAGRAAAAKKRAHVRDLEDQFARALGVRTEIREGRKKGSGRIVLHYADLDDFDRIVERLGMALDP